MAWKISYQKTDFVSDQLYWRIRLKHRNYI